MSRLFIAVDLPESAIVSLIAAQPPAAPGIRLTDPDQMHLTLYFLGEVNEHRTARIAAALAAVDRTPFPLTIAGVGLFPSKGGTTTLWAGVSPCAELHELHKIVGQALAEAGVQLEVRPYTPHVSLARCAPNAAGSEIVDFLTGQQGLLLSGVMVTRFALYSSDFRGGTPLYCCERSFPLSEQRTSPG